MSNPPRLLLVLALTLAACARLPTAPSGAAAPSPVQALDLSSGEVYTLHNACSDKVLDVEGGSAADGARVLLQSDSGKPEQQWTVEHLPDGSALLTSALSGKALDVPAFSRADGVGVVQWAVNRGDNQRWQISDLSGGLAKLSPLHAPGQALDVDGASTADGAKVQLWASNDTCAQQWKFVPVRAGPAPTPTARPLLGVYVGNDAQSVRQFEAWLGRPVDAVLGYTSDESWNSPDPGWQIDMQQYLGGTGRPVLWSIPMTPASGGAAAFREAASGARNTLYAAWAQKILAARQNDTGPIYVRTTWELGGEWFPWTQAAKDDPAAFAAGWRQFAAAFHAVSPRFKLVWDFAGDRGPVEQWYPGDAAVDVISQDVYWKPEWAGTDPDAAFSWARTRARGLDWMVAFASAHGKPLAISEWGVPGAAGNTFNGARYIDLMRDWIAGHGVLYATYWNSTADYDGQLSDNDPPAAAAELKKLYLNSAAAR